jgi:hypothetical protein
VILVRDALAKHGSQVSKKLIRRRGRALERMCNFKGSVKPTMRSEQSFGNVRPSPALKLRKKQRRNDNRRARKQNSKAAALAQTGSGAAASSSGQRGESWLHKRSVAESASENAKARKEPSAMDNISPPTLRETGRMRL